MTTPPPPAIVQPSPAPPPRQPERIVPRAPWFRVLLATEMAERFGFFGLQATLVLYLAASAQDGGLGLRTVDAAALTGTWISLTYMLGGPGGWLADRVLGIRPTMMLGGLVSMAGHFALAVPAPAASATGLVLVSVGAGLYRPNHQAMANLLFGDSARRESGISLLYVGVQFSALIAPLVVGFVGDRVNWHAGFLCGGVVMLAGLVQLALARGTFLGVGDRPGRPLGPAGRRRLRRYGVLLGAALTALTGAIVAVMPPVGIVGLLGMCTLVAPAVAFVLLYRNRRLRPVDRRRLSAFGWVILAWTLFFTMIAQGGSVMLLFAQDSTDRDIAGFEVPAGWFLSVSPLFVLIMAPVFAWLLPRLGEGVRVVPRKFAMALLLCGGSFLVMAVAAWLGAGGGRVSPLWLVAAYLLLSCSEVVVIAVGTAAASDVLPRAFIAQTIGVLGLFAAFGGGVGSQIVWLADAVPAAAYYLGYGLVVCGVGVLIALIRRRIVRGLTAADAEPAG
ncbi:oligopeptide:H+ symporter [Dactylosporangium fulvum]|uniref:Peptide MFS transporter n=1 Tax=Dactylosporangium fulvum TaxID=53359 RepID=A0ABY5W9A0_9ACTN|nr:peptide MFS transporter [Dactylosporangium fulvum]UWP86127.1 peptide MFS transporter [Dactylosporangium fulvum]